MLVEPNYHFFICRAVMLFSLMLIWGCSESETEPEIFVDFDILLSSDLVPSEISVINKTEGATSYLWTFDGNDNLPTSNDLNPGTITYSKAGTYTITLEVFNGSFSKSLSKKFTLYLTDEIVTFENVVLGSTNLESTIGVAFSTSLGKVIRSSEYTPTNGSSIDIVYFGSDSEVLYTMISPAATASTPELGLTPIPNAQSSTFVYSDDTNSEYYFSVSEYDNMTNDRILRDLQISFSRGSLTEGVSGEVDLPRVFVFQNSKGKKGLIKAKELNKGVSGNIVFDIKRQK